MFSGYGDGLICCWDVNTIQPGEQAPGYIPLLGHTNKINHIEAVNELCKVFSCANDCTVRQWSIETIGVCDRVFKFADPVHTCIMHIEKGILFVGCWDRQIRAVIYETGVVDKAWLASNSAIKTLHIHENWLFSGSLETLVRAFNLDTGDTKFYQGHDSWINCMATYFVLNEEGEVVNTWLLTGSDDSTIRIWDMKTCK